MVINYDFMRVMIDVDIARIDHHLLGITEYGCYFLKWDACDYVRSCIDPFEWWRIPLVSGAAKCQKMAPRPEMIMNS
jgi:hypothetical protein